MMPPAMSLENERLANSSNHAFFGSRPRRLDSHGESCREISPAMSKKRFISKMGDRRAEIGKSLQQQRGGESDEADRERGEKDEAGAFGGGRFDAHPLFQFVKHLRRA